jgi:hypothetical protein
VAFHLSMMTLVKIQSAKKSPSLSFFHNHTKSSLTNMAGVTLGNGIEPSPIRPARRVIHQQNDVW